MEASHHYSHSPSSHPYTHLLHPLPQQAPRLPPPPLPPPAGAWPPSECALTAARTAAAAGREWGGQACIRFGRKKARQCSRASIDMPVPEKGPLGTQGRARVHACAHSKQTACQQCAWLSRAPPHCLLPPLRVFASSRPWASPAAHSIRKGLWRPQATLWCAEAFFAATYPDAVRLWRLQLIRQPQFVTVFTRISLPPHL